MKLWLIWQDKYTGYDTYDSAVVVADTEEEARNIHPSGGPMLGRNNYSKAWADSPEEVTAELIGEAIDGADHNNGVICASFNAG